MSEATILTHVDVGTLVKRTESTLLSKLCLKEFDGKLLEGVASAVTFLAASPIDPSYEDDNRAPYLVSRIKESTVSRHWDGSFGALEPAHWNVFQALVQEGLIELTGECSAPETWRMKATEDLTILAAFGMDL